MQRQQWAALILVYHRHKNIYRLHLSAETLTNELFQNATIRRSLKLETLREIVDFMVTQQQAEYTSRKKEEVLLYWRRPEEWAQLLASYIAETGRNGSVLTLYELTEADESVSSPVHGMDKTMLRKVVEVMAKKGKAVVMKGSDGEEQGIKFL